MKLHKISLAIFLIIFINVAGFSQQSIKTLTNQIKQNLIKLDDFPFVDNTFDPDSLSLITASQLVRLLKKKKISEKEAKEIGLVCSIKTTDSSNIRIYNFYYTTGGTRASITHPVIQWTNKKEQLFAYNLSKYVNYEFNQINQLVSTSKNLYLLTGHEPGNGACIQGVIYTIQIKGDYLILDYPAFSTASYLGFCNVEIDFDEKKQKLNLLFDSYYDIYYYTDEKRYLKSKNSIQKLDNWFNQNATTNLVSLKFTGTRFRKIK